jgi:Uma2 family endonuclease
MMVLQDIEVGYGAIVAPSPMPEEIIYPETDGLPMAENTIQFDYIALIKWGLEIMYRDTPDVFIAGDLFWYPVEGKPQIRLAPDVMVALGRPKGARQSYKQWVEGNIAPQVVFEILSPGNTISEMSNKAAFYQHYGVCEYYIYDPVKDQLAISIRGEDDLLATITDTQGFVSPLLGISFAQNNGQLDIYTPEGKKFENMIDIFREGEIARMQAAQESQRAEQESLKSQKLAAKLRELGIDPDSI